MTSLRISRSPETPEEHQARLARDRERYANSPKAQRERRERHARHRERHSENHRRWYEANRAERLEANYEWRMNNPEKARDLARRQNTRKRLGRNADSVAWAHVVLADPCAYCGEPSKHVDHIEAKSRGGSNEWMNLTGACAECNIRKANAPLLIALLRHRQ